MSDLLLLLLSLSLSGTVIAGLCFAVKAIWKKKLSKSVLYYLWLIALVRLVLPFSFEGALLNRIYNGDIKAPVSTVSSYEPNLPIESAQTALSVPTVPDSNPVQIAETVSIPETVSVITPMADPTETQAIAQPNATSIKPFDFSALALSIWLTGFVVFCAFMLTSYGVFASKLKKANRPADKFVSDIARQLGCKMRIFQNPLAKTPMLIGLFRQCIILPDVLYTEEELKGAVAHELAHKRRHDLLYKWFTLFVNAVHWFNPVIWLIRREVNRACELSCDEAVIKNLKTNEKQSYGETLINLAAAHRYPAGVIATTLCEEKRTLKERLSAIMTYQKKGLWNKVLSGILIVAVVVSGTLLGVCGTLGAQGVNYPKSVNIYAPYFFYYANTDSEEQAKQEWINNMSQKYGVKLNIISDYKDSDNIYSSTSDDTVLGSSDTSETAPLVDEHGNSNFIGLSAIRNILELKTYIQYETIVPLEDYLNNNPVWNALPDDFKSIFEVDGHIYAIPTSVSRTMSARDIKNEALQKTGSTVTDLDSFRDFALSYTQTTGNPAMGGISVKGTTDILNAFGLYPGIYQSTPFSYDPQEDCIVDFMTKDVAVDALEYLRELYKAGSLRLGFNIGFNDVVASGYSSYYDYSDSYFSYFINNENCTVAFNLNPAYPQIASTLASGFTMAQNTPHPQETIDFLMDMLFGSQQNYLDCWLGSSDNYTLNEDGTITIKTTQDSKGNTVYPVMPNLTGGLPALFPYSNANIYYSQNGVVPMDSDTDVGKYNAYMKLQYDALKDESVIEIPLLYQNVIWSTNDKNINFAYRKHINYFQDAIISKNKTVQQVVDEYKAAMLNLGGNQMLDEMNAAIGKQTAYYYD